MQGKIPDTGFFNLTKDDIQLLYEYNRWVLQTVSLLSPEQFTRDPGGGSFDEPSDYVLLCA
jgi:hypothetical protein